MGRLFGTDGVRGVANRDLTAELALAARGRGRPAAGPPAAGPAGDRRGRPRPAGQRRDARGGRRRRADQRGRRRAAGRRAADPRGRPPDRRPRRRLRRDDLRVAQPDARQRHQDLRRRAGTSSTTPPRTASRNSSTPGPATRPIGAGIGRVVDAEDALDRYLRHVGKAVTTRLDGLTVVVDCAHGAASAAAPRGLPRRRRRRHRDQRRAQRPQHQRRLRVDASGALQQAVVPHGADLGLAHDGDADRCLAVDADRPGRRRRRRSW